MTDDTSPHGSSLSLPLLDHIDSICVDFETAWQAVAPPRLEAYVGNATGAERSELLRELLRLELDYRNRRTRELSLAFLQQQYPHDAPLIANVFREYAEPKDPASRPPIDAPTDGGASTADRDPASTLIAEGTFSRDTGRTAGNLSSGNLRFRIKGPHAKGGLGEVFVAHDQELRRDVALKEIQRQHAQNTKGRTRFTLEAEVTGRLEHPGIVPVYGLGHHSDGRPFYAMRLIRGQSLQQAIKQFHAEDEERSASEYTIAFRQLLGRFVDICQTIEYAHSRGVLHRDLKPSNIMLGKYGETLVLDWGLAKVMSASDVQATCSEEEPPLVPLLSEGASTDTAMGTALGTPAYMSPEQATGQVEELGPACDIYGLGATLYTLLTGRAPFAGDTADVLRAVQEGKFAPPRTHHAKVPRALETICLKAMASDPINRYSSARELAHDVEAWLADEPVSAHAEPIAARLGRWVRRHRGPVMAVAAAVAVALVGLGAGNVLLAGKNRELEAANVEVADAKRQAERRFALALEAIENYYTGVSEDVVLKHPQLVDLRERLLLTALVFYDDLRASLEQDDTPESNAALADAYLGIGKITQLVGSQDVALASHRKALDIFERLTGEDADVPQYREGLAKSHANSGFQMIDSHPSEALSHTLTAITIAETLAKEDPNNPGYHSHLVVFYNTAGRLKLASGETEQAVDYYQTALQISKDLAVSYDDVKYQSQLAKVYNNLGLVHKDNIKDPRKALDFLQLAESIHLRLVEQWPNSTEHRINLAKTYTNLGNLSREIGETQKAIDFCLKGAPLREKLIEEFPNVPEYQGGLAKDHLLLADLQRSVGERQQALANYRKAVDLFDELSKKHPDAPAYQHGAAGTYQNLGNLRREMGESEAALECYQKAVPLHEKLVDSYPDVVEHRRSLGRCYYGFAVLLTTMARRPEALVQFQRAIEIQQELAHDLPDEMYQVDLFQCSRSLGIVQSSMRHWQDAFETREKALRICVQLSEQRPNNPTYRRDIARSLHSLGRLQSTLDDLEAAVEYFEEAVAVQQELVADFPSVAEYRKTLATRCYFLGLNLRDLGDVKGAMKRCQQALRGFSELSSEYPDVISYRASIVDCHNLLGFLHHDLGNGVEAIHHCELAIEVQKEVVAAQPDKDQNAVVLASSYYNRASFSLDLGDAREALDWFDAAILQVEPVLKRNEHNSAARECLIDSHHGRAKALVQLAEYDQAAIHCERGIDLDSGQNDSLRITRAHIRALTGDHETATREATELLQSGNLPGAMLYELACIFSVSVSAVSAQEDLELSAREQLADRYGSMALELLQETCAAGFFHQAKGLQRLVEDSDLDPIREREDFKTLIRRLKDGRGRPLE